MQVYASGGHSWIAIIPFVVVVVMRMLSSSRRRQGGRGGVPGPARGFTSQASSAPAGRSAPPAGAEVSPVPGFTGTAPGWFVDPFVRHEQRWWSGTAWTEHVLDDGAPSIDPPPPPRARP